MVDQVGSLDGTRRADQRPARPGPEPARRSRARSPGEARPALRRARALRDAGLRRAAARGGDRAVRRRRGPLRQPVGARLPARLLPPRRRRASARARARSSPRRRPRRRGSPDDVIQRGSACAIRCGSRPASTGPTSPTTSSRWAPRAPSARRPSALLREPGALPAIVYAGTRKKTEETAAVALARARRARCRPTTRGWSASRAPRPSARSCPARRPSWSRPTPSGWASTRPTSEP